VTESISPIPNFHQSLYRTVYTTQKFTFIMRVTKALLSLAGGAAASTASLSIPAITTSLNISAGCQTLQTPLGDSLFFSDSSVYQYEAANFWSNTELMAPGCVFRPRSSAQLADGLAALAKANAEFAVRGGGHMGTRVRC
jgi:hypothetical protein